MVKRTFEMDLTGAPLVLRQVSLLNLQRCGARPLRRDDCLDDVTASSEPREGIDFFPLSVDYEEKCTVSGKSPAVF